MCLTLLVISLICLVGSGFVIGFTKSLQTLGRMQSKKEFAQKPYFYFAYRVIKHLFSKDPWNCFLSLLNLTQYLLCLIYSTTFFLYVFTYFSNVKEERILYSHIFIAIAIVAIIGLCVNSIFRFIPSLYAQKSLCFFTPITSLLFCLFTPITFLLLTAQTKLLSTKNHASSSFTYARIKEKFLDLVYESELSNYLKPFDRNIIGAVASIHDRIVREIMVPRVDIFSLSVNQTVHEAAQKFISEGYSRIPIYKESVDSIIGVLLYKDVMEYYFHSIEKNDTSPLQTPLEQLVKPIFYTPETKKISQILQEFRNKQIHLAIVVDEYGGTEGIVTIEDVLEELVGEIADEYDSIEEEQLYFSHPNGGWVVDAKMTILDIEKELGIIIPQNPEYDTVGGYVFHRAGAIPSKGWKIHNDNFDLEILSTSERSIEKVIICVKQDIKRRSRRD